MTPEALSLYLAGRIEVLRKVLSRPFSATARSSALLSAERVRSQFLSLRHKHTGPYSVRLSGLQLRPLKTKGK